METDRLIAELVADLAPVEPLPSVERRLLMWLGSGLLAASLIVAAAGLRLDLAAKLSQPEFVSQELAMMATAVIAGWAALSLSVPGSSPWTAWAPAVPLTYWLLAMGRQCWDEWRNWGSDALVIGFDPGCVAGIFLAALLPTSTMIAQIRLAGPWGATAALAWGTLASAALANAALRLFHTTDAGIMIVVWQFGTVLSFTGVVILIKDHVLPPLHHGA